VEFSQFLQFSILAAQTLKGFKYNPLLPTWWSFCIFIQLINELNAPSGFGNEP